MSSSTAAVRETEVVEKAKRRGFSAQYKLRILAEAESAAATGRSGEVGALLRREGLYTSHLAAWRKQREAGALEVMGQKKRGPAPKVVDERVVDGQQMLFQSSETWEELRREPVLNGVALGVQDLVWASRELTLRYPELVLGLGWLGPAARRLSPYVLLRVPDGWQRVHLEEVACSRCSWKGLIGNPVVVDVYLGSPEREKALERAWRRPVLGCPSCGSELPRRAIWVAPEQATSDA